MKYFPFYLHTIICDSNLADNNDRPFESSSSAQGLADLSIYQDVNKCIGITQNDSTNFLLFIFDCLPRIRWQNKKKMWRKWNRVYSDSIEIHVADVRTLLVCDAFVFFFSFSSQYDKNKTKEKKNRFPGWTNLFMKVVRNDLNEMTNERKNDDDDDDNYDDEE